MNALLEIFFLPPMAVARLGSSDTPLESFEWTTDKDAHSGNLTVIKPALSLAVQADGHVKHYLPDDIDFKDKDGKICPVAPFFELWAKIQSADDGTVFETPLNLHPALFFH